MNARILRLIPITLVIGAAALFAGCNKETPPTATPQTNQTPTPAVASNAAPAGAIVSAEKNSFDQVTAKLDKGGNLYLYLSTEQALSGLSKNIAGFSNFFSQLPLGPVVGSDNVARVFQVLDDLVKGSGVERISGVGASAIAREKGLYYNKVIVHHYAGQADGLIWSAFGRQPHPLKELDLLPENTALAAYADLDVPLAWKAIQQEIHQLKMPEVDKALAALPEQFKSAAGISLDDVLGSLGGAYGGGYGMLLTLDESNQVALDIPGNPMQIPEPGLAIFFKVKNDAIYARVDQLTTNNPLLTNSVQSGVKTISLAMSPPLPVWLKPSIARSGDYLFMTSSVKLLQDIIAVQTGKKSGYKATAEFKKLSQGIPAEGNNFSLVSAKFGKSLTQAMQKMAGAQAAMLGGKTNALQDMMNANSTNFTYSVGVNGPEGWESFANANKSLSSALMVLPAVAAGAAAGAVAIPMIWFRSPAISLPQNACINNLRLIDSAKQEWALENNKRNADIPTVQDLTPYMGHGPAGEFPVCPEGGKYIIGSVGEKPRCTIPGHVLP